MVWSTTRLAGTADWTQLTTSFTAPANTVAGRVDLVWDLHAGDKGWFDDVQLVCSTCPSEPPTATTTATPSATTTTATPTPSPSVTPLPGDSAVIATGVGNNVVVRPGPTDPATLQGVSITFASVTAAGSTTILRSLGLPGVSPPGQGTVLGGAYLDISTTASYTAPVDVELPYDPAALGANASYQLRLVQLTGGTWTSRTIGIDTARHVVVGRLTTLSPLALTLDPSLGPLPDVSVSFSNTSVSPQAHEATSITVGASNSVANTTAKDVVVRYTLPTGFRFQSVIPFASFCTHDGSASGGVVTCSGITLNGPIPGGRGPDVLTLTINMIAPDAAGTATHQATVAMDNPTVEGNLANNSATATQSVITPDLVVSVGTSRTVGALEPTSITVSVLNNVASTTAKDVQVQYALPTGFAFQSVSSSACAYDGTGSFGLVNCNAGSLRGPSPFSPDVFSFSVSFIVTSQPGDAAHFATARMNNPTVETNTANNSTSATWTIIAPIVDAGQTVSPLKPLPNQPVTISVGVSNAVPGTTARDVVVPITLSGLTVESFTITSNPSLAPFTCARGAASATIGCTGGQLRNTGTVVDTFGITINARVPVEGAASSSMVGVYMDNSVPEPHPDFELWEWNSLPFVGP